MHKFPIIFITALLLFVLILNPNSSRSASAAVARLGFSARYKAGQNTISLDIRSADRHQACRLQIFASRSESSITRRPGRTKPLLITTTPGSFNLRLSTTTLPAIKRQHRRSISPLFLRAKLVCGTGQRLSEVRKLSLRTSTIGATAVSQWLDILSVELIKALNGTPTPTPTVGSGTPQPTVTPTRAPLPNLKLIRAFPNLSFSSPVEFTSLAGSTNRNFVVEQSGRVYTFINSDSTTTAAEVINLSSRIASGGERGLLGFAIHPDFPAKPYFFTYYTRSSDGSIVLSRFVMDPSTFVGDLNSEVILLTIAHPNTNHNGGKLAFGPDGFLYLGPGDGGGGGDPDRNGQNLKTLLGKILRIDVDHSENGNNYAIPAGNPFKGNSTGMREEIYAYGFRNPWKFSFDSATGTLWVADVGQGAREEVDIVELGKNYGWNVMEGSICYPSGNTNCNMNGLVLPVAEYDHGIGQSITGGYVYRGTQFPGLSGMFTYGDFGSGRLFAVLRENGASTVFDLLDTGLNISSFGRDSDNEQIVLSYGEGFLYRFANR